MIHYHYKIRAVIVFCIFFLLYLIIIVKFFIIQIYYHDYFLDMGKKQYNVKIITYPSRGHIYDRVGTALALNKTSLSAFIMPHDIREPEQLTSFLHKHFPRAAEQCTLKKNKHFMYIQRKLSPAEINLINNAQLSDIHLLQEPSRFYPLQALCPVIGITDIDNKGISGIELLCNKKLAGTPTTHFLQKDARSQHFYFSQEKQSIGEHESSVQVTIDATLQFLIQEELQRTVTTLPALQGAVLVVDPTNGHLLSLAEYPSYHQKTDIRASSMILNETYELGSVMKICTALAALEEGVVSVNELIDCQGSKTGYVDGREIHTTIAQSVVPFWDVIAHSNNIGIAQIAKRLGTKLYDHYKRLGFGQKTGIEIAGEQIGFVNPPARWSKHSLFSLSYGYEIRATLLQLARAFSIIANDGNDVPLSLLYSPSQQERHRKRQPLYTPASIASIKKILHATTQQGTAKKAAVEGYTILSKTGSADLCIDGIYHRERSIFSCAGIIERGAYKRVIVTFIKEPAQRGVFASTIAAPFFARIAKITIVHDRIV